MDGERKRKVRRIEEGEVGKESKKGSVEGKWVGEERYVG